MCAISATICINTLFDKDWIAIEVCEVPLNGEAKRHTHHLTWAVTSPDTNSPLAALLEDLEVAHEAIYEQQDRPTFW